jgi:hypothetical protein
MPFLHAVLNIQQELSIVFHQDWRQLLAHARGAVGERNVVYFYSNGSATANRGAEVSECGTVRGMRSSVSTCARSSTSCTAQFLIAGSSPTLKRSLGQCFHASHLTRPTAVSALLRRLRRLQRHRSRGYIRIQSTHVRFSSRAAFSFAASTHFTADTVVVTAISHGLDKLLLPHTASHLCAIQT